MQVKLNGESVELSVPMTIAQALSTWTHIQGCFAIALNHAHVPKSAYESTSLNEGDELFIVAPMQGG